MATAGLTCSFINCLFFGILLISQLKNLNGNTDNQVHRRFEYKYSFKPPYLAQKDGSVPFWEYGGSKYMVKIFKKKSYTNTRHVSIS